MTIVPEITSVDGVARHSQIIGLPAPPPLLVDNNCRRAGTKQMGARGEAQGIRWYGGLHGQNSARGKFRTKLKYGIFPAEKSPRGIPPPPRVASTAPNFTTSWAFSCFTAMRTMMANTEVPMRLLRASGRSEFEWKGLGPTEPVLCRMGGGGGRNDLDVHCHGVERAAH